MDSGIKLEFGDIQLAAHSALLSHAVLVFSLSFFQDKAKFGGPNRKKQKCRLRQCLNKVQYILLAAHNLCYVVMQKFCQNMVKKIR